VDMVQNQKKPDSLVRYLALDIKKTPADDTDVAPIFSWSDKTLLLNLQAYADDVIAKTTNTLGTIETQNDGRTENLKSAAKAVKACFTELKNADKTWTQNNCVYIDAGGCELQGLLKQLQKTGRKQKTQQMERLVKIVTKCADEKFGAAAVAVAKADVSAMLILLSGWGDTPHTRDAIKVCKLYKKGLDCATSSLDEIFRSQCITCKPTMQPGQLAVHSFRRACVRFFGSDLIQDMTNAAAAGDKVLLDEKSKAFSSRCGALLPEEVKSIVAQKETALSTRKLAQNPLAGV